MKKGRNKKTFRKYCKYCGKMFTPNSKFSLICDKCKERSFKMRFKKCKYWKECDLYSIHSKVCNEQGGFYGAKFAGCYREREKLKHKRKV